MISMDLAEIVESLGHEVTTIARTATQAVRAAGAETPGLVLADIQLADGSSGLDAVRDILAMFEVPVIFITSFPERLLTGERPEPTFLHHQALRPERGEGGDQPGALLPHHRLARRLRSEPRIQAGGRSIMRLRPLLRSSWPPPAPPRPPTTAPET